MFVDSEIFDEQSFDYNSRKRQENPRGMCPVNAESSPATIQPPNTLTTSFVAVQVPTEAPVPAPAQPADPGQTDGNNKGSSQCGAIDDACDRAISNFRDDIIYTEFASYFAPINAGAIALLTLFKAGCVVEFDCRDWVAGAMNGKQIKDVYYHLKEASDVAKCGTAYLSNTCRVTANYCLSCHEKHQYIPGTGDMLGWIP